MIRVEKLHQDEKITWSWSTFQMYLAYIFQMYLDPSVEMSPFIFHEFVPKSLLQYRLWNLFPSRSSQWEFPPCCMAYNLSLEIGLLIGSFTLASRAGSCVSLYLWVIIRMYHLCNPHLIDKIYQQWLILSVVIWNSKMTYDQSR